MDNTFFSRDTQATGPVRAGFKNLHAKDPVRLDVDAIHAVANPRRGYTGTIHVYSGDFFNELRSQWEPGIFDEQPFSVDHAMQAFSEANERW